MDEELHFLTHGLTAFSDTWRHNRKTTKET